MEPRNLRSNYAEQILFEQRFVELGWFYERKDYAWEAFVSDETQWPTLKNVKRRQFQVQTGQAGRQAIRKVDNQDVAQAWLAFTGYANEAVQRKRELFIHDRFYNHAFKSRPLKHGYEFDFSFAEGHKDADAFGEAPLAEALLLAWLCNYLSDQLTPSGRKNRESSVKRLKLDGRKREEQDVALNDDAQYLSGLIRTSASMLFTEFCGLVLFKALGDELYQYIPQLLKNSDLRDVFEKLDVERIRTTVFSDEPSPKDTDVFSILWLTYVYIQTT